MGPRRPSDPRLDMITLCLSSGSLHLRAAVNAVNAPLQLRGRRAVYAFNGHGLLNSQLLDGLEKALAVDVNPAPGFFTQEDYQAVAGVEELILPGHGTGRQAIMESGGRPEGIVGAGYLEGVAHGGYAVAQAANAARAQLLNQVPGQAAGDSAPVGPLPAPTGNHVFGFGFLVEDQQVIGHSVFLPAKLAKISDGKSR